MRLRPLVIIGALHLATASPIISAATLSPENLRSTFASFRTADFPREVGKLIGQENGPDRAERATALLKEAISYNPSATYPTIGAACRIAPDLATRFAAAVARLQPQLAPGIARAAAAASPLQAAEIAAAVSKERPAQFAEIGFEVSSVVAGQEQRIVDAIVAGLPNLQPFTRAIAESNASARTTLNAAIRSEAVGNTSPKPVAATRPVSDLVLAREAVQDTARQLGLKSEDLLVASLTPAQAEVVNTKVRSLKVAAAASSNAVIKGVPFVPGSGTPGETNRAQTVVVTPGSGRNYNKP